jgi:hypothetical protein
MDIRVVERVVDLAGEGLTLAGIRRLLVLEEQVRDLKRQLNQKQADQLSGATDGDGRDPASERPGDCDCNEGHTTKGG